MYQAKILMTEELLPCPFCGGNAALFQNINGEYIQCSDCKAYLFPHCRSIQELVETWNTRAKSSRERGNINQIIDGVKRCPICGGSMIYLLFGENRVWCDECKISTYGIILKTYQDAIDAWNRRVPPVWPNQKIAPSAEGKPLFSQSKLEHISTVAIT